jgi:hypothetical protein
VALVDTCDRFDPESAASTALDLSQLLWIRETGDATRALKAMSLVLQAGGSDWSCWIWRMFRSGRFARCRSRPGSAWRG